jgi:hypothetical protein
LYRSAEDELASTGFRKMYWHALIHLDHAELLLRVGRGAEARNHLSTAESILGPQQGERAVRLEAVRVSVRSTTTTA